MYRCLHSFFIKELTRVKAHTDKHLIQSYKTCKLVTDNFQLGTTGAMLVLWLCEIKRYVHLLTFILYHRGSKMSTLRQASHTVKWSVLIFGTMLWMVKYVLILIPCPLTSSSLICSPNECWVITLICNSFIFVHILFFVNIFYVPFKKQFI